jgi:NADH:ubiquinone oxidoreductase subunit K
MLPEPTYNSYLMLSGVLFAIGLARVVGMAGLQGMLQGLLLMAQAVMLTLTAGARYFHADSGYWTAACIGFVGAAQILIGRRMFVRPERTGRHGSASGG